MIYRLGLLPFVASLALALSVALAACSPGPPTSPTATTAPAGNATAAPGNSGTPGGSGTGQGTPAAAGGEYTIENGEVTNTLQKFAQSQIDLMDKFYIEIKYTRDGKTELTQFQAEEAEWAKVAPGYKIRAKVQFDPQNKNNVLKSLDVISKPS